MRIRKRWTFALTGAADSLETLLELGADPNGLESPESWSYLTPSWTPSDQGIIIPVSPMDCALLAGQEDCQQVLEAFCGAPLRELIQG